MDIQEQVAAASKRLDELEEALKARRDELNRALGVVRQTKIYLAKAGDFANIAEALHVPELGPPVYDAIEKIAAILVNTPVLELQEKKQDKAPTQVKSVTRSRPEAGKKQKKERRKSEKQFGISPIAVRIIKAAFISSREVPTTLEQALELTFGQKWQEETVQVMKGPGRIDKVPISQDLSLNGQSSIKKLLGEAVNRLELIESNAKLFGYKGPTKALRSLYDSLIRQDAKPGSIRTAMTQWGILNSEAA